MSTGFVYLRPLPIVGVRAIGPYATSAQAAWRDVFQWLDESGLRSEIGCGYGLLRDNPCEVPLDQCRYDACIEVPAGLNGDVRAGFRMMRLPGGAYARCRRVGSQGLGDAITAFRRDWVAPRGLAIDPSRPFIEIYLDDPAVVAPAERRVDICVPTKAAMEVAA